VFGSDSQAAYNITGVAILFCLAMVVALSWLPPREDVPLSEIITALIGIIGAALGYLWGRRAS